MLDHRAPARLGRLHAEAEQAQLGLGDQREPDRERHRDDQRRRDVGQDALAADPPGLVPIDRDASMNVSSRTASVCARIRRAKPGITTNEMASIAFSSPAPSIADDREREHQRWEAGQAVHDPHEALVGAAAPEAREQADRHREEQREDHDLESGAQRHPRAVDDPAEGVAPEVRRCRTVCPRLGRDERRRRGSRSGVRRNQRREHAAKRTTAGGTPSGDDRRLVAEQPPERAAPRARVRRRDHATRRARCRRPRRAAGSGSGRPPAVPDRRWSPPLTTTRTRGLRKP